MPVAERMEKESKFNVVLQKFPELFDSKFELTKDMLAKLIVKEGTKPVYLKHRTLFYILNVAVTARIRELETNDILIK